MSKVYELNPAGYEPGRALFEAANVTFDRPFWESAFDGGFPGRLIVDDAAQPRSALLVRTYEYFLAGEPTHSIISFLSDAPPEANPLELFYGYVPLTQSWLEAMLIAFPEVYREARRSFRLGRAGAEEARSWRSRVPGGIRVEALDQVLARRAEADIPIGIEPALLPLSRFGSDYFGYVAIDEETNRVLSIAFTGGVSRREVNLDVSTTPAEQRRGLGRLLCQACCDQAISAGMEVTWDCDRVNTASGALAESLGFVEEAPFVELAFPDPEKGMPHRIVPAPSGRPWHATRLSNGVTRWTAGAAEPPA